MSNRRKAEELKGAQVLMKDFEMYKNGKFNYKCPREFNYALGFATPGMQPKTKVTSEKVDCPFRVPAARVNGQHVVSNTWQ